jgi:hypothetical protein
MRVVGMTIVNADHPKQCTLDLDNYFECLHHKKEVCCFDLEHAADLEIESGADKTGMGQATKSGTFASDTEVGVQ